MERHALDRGAAGSLPRGHHHADIPDSLVHLFAAATAPAGDAELAGEESAVVAFRQSYRPPLHTPGRRSLLAGLLTVKGTAAFALTAAPGTASPATATATTRPIPDIRIRRQDPHHDGRLGRNR